MTRKKRLAAYDATSSLLAAITDTVLLERLDAAKHIGSGIGGETVLFEVEGISVFAKRVRLTDLELQEENMASTANLFELPLACHYGIGSIGSPGFGAWRELTVHTMATNWVIQGDYEGFPMMYHSRVLRDSGQSLPDELANVERTVAYWGGGPGIRRRMEGLERSPASLVLFLEYIPQTLHDWLGIQVARGGEVADGACAMVDTELRAGIAFMNSRGLLHFDVHFGNILTDGERLYFADYGLAIARTFELAADELRFFEEHDDYDRRYSVTYLVNWLAVATFGFDSKQRTRFVQSCAREVLPDGLPAGLLQLLRSHAPTAVVLQDFFDRFEHDTRNTPYPAATIDRAER